MTLPSFLYGPILNNAHVLAASPVVPKMKMQDTINTLLSCGIYYITDLSGELICSVFMSQFCDVLIRVLPLLCQGGIPHGI